MRRGPQLRRAKSQTNDQTVPQIPGSPLVEAVEFSQSGGGTWRLIAQDLSTACLWVSHKRHDWICQSRLELTAIISNARVMP